MCALSSLVSCTTSTQCTQSNLFVCQKKSGKDAPVERRSINMLLHFCVLCPDFRDCVGPNESDFARPEFPALCFLCQSLSASMSVVCCVCHRCTQVFVLLPTFVQPSAGAQTGLLRLYQLHYPYTKTTRCARCYARIWAPFSRATMFARVPATFLC